MKFLVLTLCVCAASAASYDYKPYQPVQQYQPFRPASVPVVAAAKTTYNAGQYVANVPVTAAKTTYNAAKFVATAPVTTFKKTYNNVEVVTETPVINTRTAYDAAQVVAAAPVIAAKPFYDEAQVVAAAPIFPAEAVYKATPAVAKTAYPTVAKTVYNSGKEYEAAILRSDAEVGAEGYNYGYETANGIAAQASGFLKNVDNTRVLVSEGSYQYPAADGTLVQLSYVADENGFQPRSDFLPVAPPVPEAILRSLEYIRTHPSKPENY